MHNPSANCGGGDDGGGAHLSSEALLCRTEHMVLGVLGQHKMKLALHVTRRDGRDKTTASKSAVSAKTITFPTQKLEYLTVFARKS